MAKEAKDKKNIKNYGHYLWLFITVNLTIFLVIALKRSFNLDNLNGTYNSLRVEDGLIAAISSLFTFVLNGLLPSNFKATLVFWRIHDTLPGCRVFTDLIDKDYRIEKADIIRKFGKLPTEPQAQNTLWYKIYKENEFDPMIFDSHRNFLLSRDLTGLSFLFLIIYTSLAILIFKIGFNVALLYIVFLLTQYIILAIVSQNYGKRFTCNALARACFNK